MCDVTHKHVCLIAMMWFTTGRCVVLNDPYICHTTLAYATKQAPPLFKQGESFVIPVSRQSGQIMNGGSSRCLINNIYHKSIFNQSHRLRWPSLRNHSASAFLWHCAHSMITNTTEGAVKHAVKSYPPTALSSYTKSVLHLELGQTSKS